MTLSKRVLPVNPSEDNTASTHDSTFKMRYHLEKSTIEWPLLGTEKVSTEKLQNSEIHKKESGMAIRREEVEFKTICLFTE